MVGEAEDSIERVARYNAALSKLLYPNGDAPPPPPLLLPDRALARKRRASASVQRLSHETPSDDDNVRPRHVGQHVERQFTPEMRGSSRETVIVQSAGAENAETALQVSTRRDIVAATQDTRSSHEPGDGAQVREAAWLAARSGDTQYTAMASAVQIRAETKAREGVHTAWRLYRVISGHQGWVRSVAVDPSNSWFASGSADRTIKAWDLASGTLKLTLTGHVGGVRALVLSHRHPYLFSAGDDNQVKCWDLEYNKVVRHYHGHLSGVYAAALHPALDVLATGGRDSTVRIWDIRTKQQVHALASHRDVVNAILTDSSDPQIISASADKTIRLWDLAAGKSMRTLTNHRKGIRALAHFPAAAACAADLDGVRSFASASADRIKTWELPDGNFWRNMSSDVTHDRIVHALACNEDGLLVSGDDAGSIGFFDYSSAAQTQRLHAQVQPGSLASEAAILCVAFDQTGLRLITGEADKSIKMWKPES